MVAEQKHNNIRDLGIIGDRRTCALVTKQGDIVWYCPTRFDKAAYFSRLIDPEKGGFWSYNYKAKEFVNRHYSKRCAVLTTNYTDLKVEDFMPLSKKNNGICRLFSVAPEKIENIIYPKPFYGLALPEYEQNKEKNIVVISRSLKLAASHQISIKDNKLCFTIPKGETGWAFLFDQTSEEELSEKFILSLKNSTINKWEKIALRIKYKGVYEKQVNDSLRAIQLMTFHENGGIIAAGTTSLPEVIGGSRNYDYRFVWLRDSAMITRAMIRAESELEEENKFLSFLCDARYRNSQKILLPFYSLDKLVAQPEEELPIGGFMSSIPSRIGNNAMDQLQLDANANVLLTAGMIYRRSEQKEHWETIAAIADHLVERWQEKDHGIWEEEAEEHFTSSKVIVCMALELIADFAEEEEQRWRWLKASGEIRNFVMENCLTKSGAFATFPGSEKVDVTAALFPTWKFTEAASPEMDKTIELLERDHRQGDLYHRTLEDFDAAKEGVFLAGCFWMAQYYILKDDLQKAVAILEAGMRFSNDLGFFGEEGDPDTGEMLGNFPQTFVHASFIDAITDLNKKVNNNKKRELKKERLWN